MFWQVSRWRWSIAVEAMTNVRFHVSCCAVPPNAPSHWWMAPTTLPCPEQQGPSSNFKPRGLPRQNQNAPSLSASLWSPVHLDGGMAYAETLWEENTARLRAQILEISSPSIEEMLPILYIFYYRKKRGKGETEMDGETHGGRMTYVPATASERARGRRHGPRPPGAGVQIGGGVAWGRGRAYWGRPRWRWRAGRRRRRRPCRGCCGGRRGARRWSRRRPAPPSWPASPCRGSCPRSTPPCSSPSAGPRPRARTWPVSRFSLLAPHGQGERAAAGGAERGGWWMDGLPARSLPRLPMWCAGKQGKGRQGYGSAAALRGDI